MVICISNSVLINWRKKISSSWNHTWTYAPSAFLRLFQVANVLHMFITIVNPFVAIFCHSPFFSYEPERPFQKIRDYIQNPLMSSYPFKMELFVFFCLFSNYLKLCMTCLPFPSWFDLFLVSQYSPASVTSANPILY